MRTYAGGGGVNEKPTGSYKGEGGSEISDFTAYVLYGCPLIEPSCVWKSLRPNLEPDASVLSTKERSKSGYSSIVGSGKYVSQLYKFIKN